MNASRVRLKTVSYMTAIHTPNKRRAATGLLYAYGTDPITRKGFERIAESLRKPTGHWFVRWAFLHKRAYYMNIFTVSFFGHRIIDNPFPLEQKLEDLIRELLHSKEYVEFLIGRDGEFDQIVSSTIRRCKRSVRNDNSALVLVLPYATAEYLNNEQSFHDYYDEVEICAEAAEHHFKSAHQIRNRSMVDRSDLVVFCVEHSSGGAFQTMQYAKKVNANIVNFKEG